LVSPYLFFILLHGDTAVKEIEKPDLSVIIPARNEAENLAHLIPQIRSVLGPLNLVLEIIVVDELPDDEERLVVSQNGAILLSPPSNGYGLALQAGFNRAHADYIATIDADLSHPPKFLHELWNRRHTADISIASRYVVGGRAEMPLFRLWLSRMINLLFSRGLDLQIKDMSSGFRMYNRRCIPWGNLSGKDFNILQELLVKALTQGYRIREIPFNYKPRACGSSHARVIKFGLAYLRTFIQLWRIRNSIASGDYDARAYDTWFFPQRYWQRKRYKHIMNMAKGKGRCLDVGCGSSRILEALPPESVGLDILIRKLRYAKMFNRPLIQGSVFNLPIKDRSFPCVICSQMIEHVKRANVMNEIDRAIEPGGFLILGTPDYSKWQWVLIEWLYGKILPQGYADEHITHYTYGELIQEFVDNRGYTLEASRTILQGELILVLRKPIPQG
jgi:dolichol-phosphate mannosyltransferase